MKERYEWIQSWCDNAEKDDLPRVLLVGDSIVGGYNGFVREALGGICYVDHFATSYAVDTDIYKDVLTGFVADSRYDAVHINHGLHGKHMTADEYESGMRKLLDGFPKSTKIAVALTTCVNEGGNAKRDESWMNKVTERNAVLEKIAKERGYAVNDLFSESEKVPVCDRHEDGTHYKDEGYRRFADKAVAVIKSLL